MEIFLGFEATTHWSNEESAKHHIENLVVVSWKDSKICYNIEEKSSFCQQPDLGMIQPGYASI